MSSSTWSYISTALSVLLVLGLGKMVLASFWPYIKNVWAQASVEKSGSTIDAEIIQAVQTRAWDGGRPIYTLTFRFKTQEGKEVEASLMKPLSFQEIEDLKPGKGATIKYDPNNPTRIALPDPPTTPAK